MQKLKFVLLIDDDETSNLVTEIILQRHNPDIEIETLLNGKEATEYFENCTPSCPQVILLDINMPLMDGWDFLNWYERNGHQGKTKVAMFSSSVRQEDQDKAKEFLDVVDYIEKPLSPEKIERLLERLEG